MAWSLRDKSFSQKISSLKDILKVVGFALLILSGELKIGHLKSSHITGAYPIILSKLIVGALGEKLNKKQEQSLSHALALLKALLDTSLSPIQKAIDFTTFEIINLYNSYQESRGSKRALTIILLTSLVMSINPSFLQLVKSYSVRKLLSLALFLVPVGVATKVLSKEEVEIPMLMPSRNHSYRATFPKHIAQFDAVRDTYTSFIFINALLPLASLLSVKILLCSVLFLISYVVAHYNHFKYKEIPKQLSKIKHCIAGIRPGCETQDYLEQVYKKLLLSGLPVVLSFIIYPMAVSLYTHVNIMWAGVTIPSIVAQCQEVEREFRSLNISQDYPTIIRGH